MSYLVLQRGMALSHSIEDYPDGIVVVVDKPYRWTSADVIRKVKWMAIKHFRKAYVAYVDSGHEEAWPEVLSGIYFN